MKREAPNYLRRGLALFVLWIIVLFSTIRILPLTKGDLVDNVMQLSPQLQIWLVVGFVLSVLLCVLSLYNISLYLWQKR